MPFFYLKKPVSFGDGILLKIFWPEPFDWFSPMAETLTNAAADAVAATATASRSAMAHVCAYFWARLVSPTFDRLSIDAPPSSTGDVGDAPSGQYASSWRRCRSPPPPPGGSDKQRTTPPTSYTCTRCTYSARLVRPLAIAAGAKPSLWSAARLATTTTHDSTSRPSVTSICTLIDHTQSSAPARRPDTGPATLTRGGGNRCWLNYCPAASADINVRAQS